MGIHRSFGSNWGGDAMMLVVVAYDVNTETEEGRRRLGRGAEAGEKCGARVQSPPGAGGPGEGDQRRQRQFAILFSWGQLEAEGGACGGEAVVRPAGAAGGVRSAKVKRT